MQTLRNDQSQQGLSSQAQRRQIRKRLTFDVFPSAIIAIGVALALYLPSLEAGFIHDDHFQIVTNPQVQSWDYLPRLLSTDVWSQNGMDHVGHYYRPLFSVWMLLVYTVAGPNAFLWHLSNVLLHAMATYLVYILCGILLNSNVAALFGSLLYAVHPIHVDAISWVSASNELLLTIFVLAALLALAKAIHEQKISWLVLSICLYGAALMSKETAIAVLPIFPVVYWLVPTEKRMEPQSTRRILNALRNGALYASLAAIYLLARSFILRRTGVEGGKHSFAEVLFSSPQFLGFYLKKLFWPSGLAGFYVNPLVSSPTASMWLASGALLLGIGLFIWLACRFSGVFAFAGLLILLPLLPPLAGIRVYDQGNMTHDRYLYLPSVGLCLLLSFAVGSLWRDERVHPAVLLICIPMFAFLGYLTVRQQKFYHDDEAFYERAIAVDPRNALVMGYLGDAYLEENENEQAMEWFERGLETAPNDANAKFYLARGLMKTLQFSAAEPYLKDLAYGTQPIAPKRKSAVLLSLANAEVQLNEPDMAERTLKDLVKFDFRFPGLHRTLGIVYQRRGRIKEAQEEYALEFQITTDRESGRQAIALARLLTQR